MSSSVSGRGGLVTIYLKHCELLDWISRQREANTYVQALVELLLLFINYAQTEINFVGLLEVWLHAHDLRKRLLGVFERSIAII
jgi:hypothetical protein